MPILVGIIGLPKLLADVIAAAFSGDDVRVGHFSDRCASEERVAELLNHDVVIAGVDDPLQCTLLDKIAAAMGPRVLGMRTDGREAWIYEMQPRARRLGPASPEQIRAAVLDGYETSP